MRTERFRHRRDLRGMRPSGPVILTPQPATRLSFGEAEAGAYFGAVMQAEAVRRNARGAIDRRQRVQLVIQVAEPAKAAGIADAKCKWYDAEVYWEGYWDEEEGGPRIPPISELLDVLARSGMGRVRYVFLTYV